MLYKVNNNNNKQNQLIIIIMIIMKQITEQKYEQSFKDQNDDTK